MSFDFKSYTKNTTPAEEKESKRPNECVRNCFCVSDVTDEEKEQKINYKKKFIMIYCIVGIFFGLFWVGAGYYCQNADVIKEFSDIQASGNDPTAAIIDVEDFTRISWFLFLTGVSISFFSLVGLISAYQENAGKKGLIIFSSYLFFYVFVLLITVIVFLLNASDLNKRIKQDSIRFWKMAVHPASPFDKYLRNYEETHLCCGWNNAIDYCDQKALSALMEEVIDQKATEKAIKYKGGLSEDASSYPYYGDSVYSVSQDSLSSSYDDSLRSQQPLQFCAEDEAYDGDEACICDTVENFENDAGRGFLDLKYLNCVHDSTFCYYSQSSECETGDENIRYEPWRETNSPQNITVGDVCSENTCFVNGCGDMFSDDFWQYGAPSILACVAVSIIFFIFGIYKTCHFTILVWTEPVKKQLTTTELGRRTLTRTRSFFKADRSAERSRATESHNIERIPLNRND
ncbi:unnamed protein product [Oikopleura dioica]|uniref:Tetraspanin n=1 Tax=Oikopleura dioica TaxID=34765 RepID=E4XTI0_OIKDI|nr:unnamed protein product [Oikopleura dioica]